MCLCEREKKKEKKEAEQTGEVGTRRNRRGWEEGAVASKRVVTRQPERYRGEGVEGPDRAPELNRTLECSRVPFLKKTKQKRFGGDTWRNKGSGVGGAGLVQRGNGAEGLAPPVAKFC